MKNDLNSLLAETLAEAPAGGFQEGLFRQTLAAARRRRRYRRFGQVSSVVALVAGLALVRWDLNRPFAPPAVAEWVPSPPEPAAAGASQTSPVAAPVDLTVVTTASRSAAVPIVTTAAAGEPIPRIDDRQLLALLGEKPAAIVWRAPGRAELVFANPADRDLVHTFSP